MVRRRQVAIKTLLLAASLLLALPAAAQTLYKYKGENGEWIYSDRPPVDGRDSETRALTSSGQRGGVSVSHSYTGSSVQIVASNRFHAPIEVGVVFDTIEGVEYPSSDEDRVWVVPARSDLVLLDLPALGSVAVPNVQYSYVWVPGDPAATPDSGVTYRAPYSVGTSYPVTQAYPDSATHRTRDAMYAVDFAMPVGTDIVAARDGIVFDVASKNYKGGTDANQYADLANIVRILHDDGTIAVYAHLNWNSIRVNPGDRVAAGQYIADSGNTGFSSGPHLHFAVHRNMGMRIDSVPVSFRGANGEPVSATTDARLTAYP